MSRQNITLLSLSVLATTTVATCRFVTYAGAQAGAAAAAMGVASFDAASGDTLTVDCLGTAVVEVGGAIAVGGAVESDSSGRAVAQNTGPALGRALQASTAAGQLIEILLTPA